MFFRNYERDKDKILFLFLKIYNNIVWGYSK